MREKIHFILACGFCIFVFVFLTGCTTRPVVIGTDEHIVAAQVSTARLQRANDLSRDALDFASITNRLITESARAGQGGIDTALELLGRYDSFVQSLVARIRELELATREGTGEGENEKQNIISVGNPFLD